MRKRLLSMLTALVLCLSLLPVTAWAEDNSVPAVYITDSSFSSGKMSESAGAGTVSAEIVEGDGGRVLNVTLSNVTINTSRYCGIYIEVSNLTSANIFLVGNNVISAGERGLVCGSNCPVTISGAGSDSGLGSLAIRVNSTSYYVMDMKAPTIRDAKLDIYGGGYGIKGYGGDFTICGESQVTIHDTVYGIYGTTSIGTMTIKDNSQVTIQNSTNNGIYSYGPISIEGNAQVNIYGSISDESASEVTSPGTGGGIYSDSSVTISGGTVTINMGSYGIRCVGNGGVAISGNASVKAAGPKGIWTGATVTVEDPATLTAIVCKINNTSDKKGLTYTVYGEATLNERIALQNANNSEASLQLTVPASATLTIGEGGCLNVSDSTVTAATLENFLTVEGSLIVAEGGSLILPADTTAQQVEALHLTGGAQIGDTTYYLVTFDSQGGAAVESQLAAADAAVAQPDAPQRAGHTFGGWYTDEECTTLYNFETAVTQETTLYAKWIAETYSITFDSQEGTEVEGQTVAYGGAVTQPASPTRSGYTFGGWYTDPDCTTPYSFGAPVEGPLTLYAKWTVRSSGGGSSSSTTTEKNPDGSTTTTTTNKTTGTVTETTKYPDGSATTVETKRDGTVTTTEKTADGTTTQTVETPDGSTSTTVKEANGTTATQVTDSQGRTETQVSLSAQAVEEARKTGEPVALPIPPVPPAQETEAAPVVEIALPQGEEPVSVVIPAQDPTPGTVAVLLRADGTEEVVKDSLVTQEGVLLTLEEGASVKLLDNAMAFGDTQDHWAEDAIAFTSARELFAGTGPGTFSPESPMTRAMLLTVLARLEGVDTTGGETWYQQAVDWAVSAGISDGSSPNASITREQMVTMLWRLVGSPTPEGSLTGFADGASVSDYARAGVTWAVDQGILFGTTSTTLSPQGNATRAEVATILMRFLNQK